MTTHIKLTAQRPLEGSERTKIYLDLPGRGSDARSMLMDRYRARAHYKGDVLAWIRRAMPAYAGRELRVRFSQKAGCSMCPCSPGFLVDVKSQWTRSGWEAMSLGGMSYWLELADGSAPYTLVEHSQTCQEGGE